MQPEICSLCSQEPKTTSYLILHCTFAQQVWSEAERWTQHLVGKPGSGLLILDLVGEGAGATIQESKENQGNSDDLHHLEYLEGEELPRFRPKVYLTIRGVASYQE